MYLLCFGVTGSMFMFDAVTGLSSFKCLDDTSMCVPSQTTIMGLCLHQGSTSLLKSISILAIHANIQLTNVFMFMNGAGDIFIVLYLLVNSLQKAAKEVFVFCTILIKSQPISSPAHVTLDRKKIDLSSPVYSRLQLFTTHFLEHYIS